MGYLVVVSNDKKKVAEETKATVSERSFFDVDLSFPHPPITDSILV